MGCCGSKRAAISGITGSSRGNRARIGSPLPSAEFEYIGRTTLRVVGPATRRDYWFERPGARVQVDGRDAPALDGIPLVARVQNR